MHLFKPGQFVIGCALPQSYRAGYLITVRHHDDVVRLALGESASDAPPQVVFDSPRIAHVNAVEVVDEDVLD